MTNPERYLEAELERTRQERDDARCLLDEAKRIIVQVAQPWRELPDPPNFESATAMGLWQQAFEPIRQARAFLDLVEKKR